MGDANGSTPRLDGVLARAGLSDLAERFHAEDIDDNLLDDLTEEDLRGLGLSLGARKKFFKALSELAPVQAMRAERRHLTVVFCDLVGSTQLATRFDPEDLRGIISTYLDTAIGSMQSHGCHLAYTQGDGFMMYFGYPKAGEDDAERALRAALTTIQTVENLETKVPEGLKMRAGIATGLVVIGDVAPNTFGSQDFVVGETPNLAARLQSLAEPGEVVVSEETWSLTKGSFDFEPRGKHALKGFADAQSVYCVLAENTEANRFDARRDGRMKALVGRDRELNILADSWNRAKDGTGQLALISGPAGIGKSRLIRQLIEETEADPYFLQCAPHLSSQALHPIANDIRRIIGKHTDEETARAQVTGLIESSSQLAADDEPWLMDLAGYLVALPEAGDALKKARKTQDLLMRCVGSLCDARGTLLLVLEDLHWADATTQEFTEALIGRLGNLPILFVMTYRPEHEPSELAQQTGSAIELLPLQEDEAANLVREVAGHRQIPSILVRKIVEKADGVPLFVEEMTKSLLEQIPQQGQISTEALEKITIPTTLQDSLMARLDRMGDAKLIAQRGAVIGRGFTDGMIRLLASDVDDVGSALERLKHAGLLMQVGSGEQCTYIFSHALIQDAAYDSLLRDDRRELHLKLATAMLENHPAFGQQSPDVIARHCDLGGRVQEAVAHWISAGEQAASLSANISAISAFRAALRNLDAMDETPERDGLELGVQMRLAPAYMAIHGWGAEQVGEAAARAQALAAKLGDHESLFGATWGVWSNFFLRGELGPALDTANAIEAMAAAAPPGLPGVMAHYAKAYTHYFRGELTACLKHTEAGIAAVSPEIDQAMLPIFQIAAGSALRAIQANAYWLTGRTKEAYRIREQALDYARGLNNAPNLAHCYALTTMFMLYAKDWPNVDQAMKEADAMAEEEGFLYFQPMHTLYLSVSAFGQQQASEALGMAHYVTDAVYASGAHLTLAQSECVLCELLVDAGQIDLALERLDKICGPAFEDGETVLKAEYHRVRSRAFAARGDHSLADAEARLALDEAKKSGATALVARAEHLISEFAS